jgi:hypothetical protein
MQVNVFRMPLLFGTYDEFLKKDATDTFSSPVFRNGNTKGYIPAIPTEPWFCKTISDEVTVHKRFQVYLFSFSLRPNLGSEPLFFFFERHWSVHKEIGSFSCQSVDKTLEFSDVFLAVHRFDMHRCSIS